MIGNDLEQQEVKEKVEKYGSKEEEIQEKVENYEFEEEKRSKRRWKTLGLKMMMTL